MSVTDNATYMAEMEQWRQKMDDSLRAEDGWLSLVGLHWLQAGLNTIGLAPTADIPLPDGVPSELGTLEWADDQFTLRVTVVAGVTVDNEPVTGAIILRDDSANNGASIVRIGSVSFFVIRRGDEYAVRVRDTNNPDRQAFTGRKWFPLDSNYRVAGTLIPHAIPRILQVINSAGQIAPMKNPARVEFVLAGQTLHLEAFAARDLLWFVFKDATSGQSTYGAGRFMYASPTADGSITLDFNRAYHPPCAYTPYATCPRPLPENILPIPILAGEHS